MTMTATRAAGHVERVPKIVGPKAMELLTWLAGEWRSAGLTVSEPSEMFGDNYSWTMSVGEHPGHDHSIEVTIEVAEAHDFGDLPLDGVSFRLDIVRWGGEILGDFAPHNFTELCWVSASDVGAVMHRWYELELPLREQAEGIAGLLTTEINNTKES